MEDLLVVIVPIVAAFTFVSVAVWAENRRKERESYYRHETYRKMMEVSAPGTQAVVEFMREEEARAARKRVDGMKFAGLVMLAVGVGLMVFLRFLVPSQPVYLVGVIPLLIGVVMAVYGFFMMKQPS